MSGFRFDAVRTREVHILGTDYLCREPSLQEQVEYERGLKTSDPDEIVELLYNFVASLGVPRDATSQMPKSAVLELMKYISGDDSTSKKKITGHAYLKAKLARFYGWTDSYICALPLSVVHEYLNAIIVIQSEEYREMALASAVSNMKKDAKDKYFNRLNKNTKLVDDGDDGKIVSTEDAAKKLARVMMHG